MSLPLGKLTILVGAGILGSVLAKEGRLPSFSDVVSGALKVALKPITQNDSASSTKKPRNDALIAQVNNLRQELQLLSSSRPVTIVTSSATGGRRYGVIIVIVVIGYGYVWWKGWKLPDFMFATKRSLSDACNSVAGKLENVYSSITTTKKDLSSQLDQSSLKYDDIVTCSATTKDQVSEVRGEVSKFTMDLHSVNHKIRTLETRMGRIQEKQDETKEGVAKLLLCTLNAENRFTDVIQDSPSSSSRSALEHPRITATSRTVSLPPALTLESPSPSASNGSSEVKQNLRNATSARGLKEEGISATVDNIANTSPVSNGNDVSESSEKPPSPELPQSLRPGFLSRTFSAAQYFKFK